MTAMRHKAIVLALGVMLLATAGCVRRTLTVQTEPEGARVWLNNEEIGTSPVTVDFTWYGDYDVTLRKEGYQTLQTNYAVTAPWYQWPGIDFFAEVLVPLEIHDRRQLPVYTLEPEVLPDPDELVKRADDMRTQAVFGED
jgi:hypothetical protein